MPISGESSNRRSRLFSLVGRSNGPDGIYPGKFACIGDLPLVNVGLGHSRHNRRCPKLSFVRFGLPAQPIDATQALNLSAGVSNCKVSRGRSLS